MTVTENKNLAVRVSSDPNLIKIFSRLKEPQFRIPTEYEDEIKTLRGVKSTDKGILVSKVTTPDDYQKQLSLLSSIQHCLDRIHEINTDLYIIQAKWKELLNSSTRIIMLAYYVDLNELKEGVRKTLMSIALQPIQEGIDRIQTLIEIGETTQKHLTATNFNIKEGTEIISEYLTLLKYGPGGSRIDV